VAQVAAELSAIRTDGMSLIPEPGTDAAAASAIVDWYAKAMRDGSDRPGVKPPDPDGEL
jgi:hypothetical protein